MEEREEQMEEVLSGRATADVAPQKAGVLSRIRSRTPANAASGTSPIEPNSQDRNRKGSASSAIVFPSWPSPIRPTKASERVSLVKR